MKTGKEWLCVCECGVECRDKGRHPEIGACPTPRQELGRSRNRYGMRLQKAKGVADERAAIGRELEVGLSVSLQMNRT